MVAKKTFSISMDQESAQKVILHFNGRLNSDAESLLRSQWQQFAESDLHSVIFDLSGLEHIDPAGLMQFMILITRLQSWELRLSIRGLQSGMASVIELTGLAHILQVEQSAQGEKTLPGWSKAVRRADLRKRPQGMVNINMNGRQPTSPHLGFGRMLLRRYCLTLPDAEIKPSGIMQVWKDNFSDFWPPGNRFYTEAGTITPGEIGFLNLRMPGGLILATGVLVSYADETSFSLMTLQGHMFAGWINFSSYLEDGNIVIEIQALIRPNDLLYELSFLLGFGPRSEDAFWVNALENLSENFGLHGNISKTVELIDARMQWRNFFNIMYNAGLGSTLYLILRPFRWLIKSLSKKES